MPGLRTGACADWDGDPSCAVSGFQIRALTKHEEGGRRRGRVGAHADFILTIRRQDPGSGVHRAGSPELRIMVQAKRADPCRPAFRPDQSQYGKLVEIAPAYGAVPYYALYVQQPGPHDSVSTACHRAVSASDRSIVLAAAFAGPAALPGRPLTGILHEARPLRCLAGCTCADPGGHKPGQPDPGSVWDSALRFITRDFPATSRSAPSRSCHRAYPRCAQTCPSTSPPGTGPGTGQSRACRCQHQAPGDDQVLLIRLGAQQESPTPDRPLIGYAPGMSAGELRDSARMYWRLGSERAQRVSYLVISAGGRALDACEVAPIGLTFVEGADGRRRVAFTVTGIASSDLKRNLLARAERRLSRLPPGARNPAFTCPVTPRADAEAPTPGRHRAARHSVQECRTPWLCQPDPFQKYMRRFAALPWGTKTGPSHVGGVRAEVAGAFRRSVTRAGRKGTVALRAPPAVTGPLGPFEAVFQIGAGAPCRVTPVMLLRARVSVSCTDRGSGGRRVFSRQFRVFRCRGGQADESDV